MHMYRGGERGNVRGFHETERRKERGFRIWATRGDRRVCSVGFRGEDKGARVPLFLAPLIFFLSSRLFISFEKINIKIYKAKCKKDN